MSGVLEGRFTFPPFSILDARSQKWRRKKQAWLARGIRSELGRDKNLLRKSETVLQGDSGTSVFDPVLCELMYKWFAPSGGQVIDPFAGGSVRGIVAGCCDLDYWGCDLSERQIKENRKQAKEVTKEHPKILRKIPQWVVGDSLEKLDDAPEADFLFSCPPFGNLEIYSQHPRDISNMSHDKFLVSYRAIIAKAVSKLRGNSFACFVVMDFRDENGDLRNLVSKTIQAFEDAGAKLRNHAILSTPTKQAAIVAEPRFTTSRNLSPVHQNVLVFLKGEWREAVARNVA